MWRGETLKKKRTASLLGAALRLFSVIDMSREKEGRKKEVNGGIAGTGPW